MKELQINPELKRLIPPLSSEEFAQLEKNCLEYGIRDPLVVWFAGWSCDYCGGDVVVTEDDKQRAINIQWTLHYQDRSTIPTPDEMKDYELFVEGGCEHCGHKITNTDGLSPVLILVDGHNRYQIAQKHGLEFNVVDMEFADVSEVEQWMDENQIGRRNLHPKHFKLLLGRIYNRRKKAAGGRADREFGGTKKVPPKTRQEIAQQYDVGEQTVVRAGRQQQVVQDLAAATGKSEFEVIDEIGKDKHINKIASRQKKEPERPITEIADEVLSEAQKREQKQEQKREEVKTTLKKLSLLEVVGSKKYRVIYADPPWQYNDSKKIDGYSGTDDHYITMPLEAICKMPVRQITEENAILFLWVTSPFLEDSFRVINSWGFKYKSSFVWDKVRHNMGHYNSVRHEFLLIATKGSCTPDEAKLFDSVQSIDRTEIHSEKPEEFRTIIDTLYTFGRKLEIFGRKSVDGWTVFGNQKIEQRDTQSLLH